MEFLDQECYKALILLKSIYYFQNHEHKCAPNTTFLHQQVGSDINYKLLFFSIMLPTNHSICRSVQQQSMYHSIVDTMEEANGKAF